MVLTESKKLLIISRDRELINQIRRTFNSTEISVNYQDVKRADVIIMDRRDNREIPQDRKFQSKMICIIYKVSQQEIESLSAQGVNHIITLPEFKYWLFCLLKRYLGYTNSDTSKYSYKGITVCKDTTSIIYNDCRVILTSTELEILENILRKECPYCKVDNPSTISTISRINKKTKRGTGIKIIGNRYRKGYYISV